MSMFRCPECGSPNVRVEGKPILVEFDEEGPTQFIYEEDVTTDLPLEGDTECLNCSHLSATGVFRVG